MEDPQFTLTAEEEAEALGLAIEEIDEITETFSVDNDHRLLAMKLLRLGQAYGFALESGKSNKSVRDLLLRGADMGRFAWQRIKSDYYGGA